jgi:hypothetical protein
MAAVSLRVFGEICARCGVKTELLWHRFYVGNPEKPIRQWEYLAPLYHTKEIGFCSSECSLKEYESQK